MASLLSSAMVNAALELPTPCQVATRDDFTSIGLWATQQRRDLARLTKELRALQATLAASADGSPPAKDENGPTPTAFAPGVDVMLEAAMEQLDAEADAAREAAAAVVAAAMREAAELLTAVGADAATVHRLTTRSDDVPQVLRRPRGATELWRAVEASRGTLHAEAPDPPPSAETAPIDVISSALDRGHNLVGQDASQVHDLFWGSAASDRPVRERLRRFGQRSQL